MDQVFVLESIFQISYFFVIETIQNRFILCSSVDLLNTMANGWK